MAHVDQEILTATPPSAPDPRTPPACHPERRTSRLPEPRAWRRD